MSYEQACMYLGVPVRNDVGKSSCALVVNIAIKMKALEARLTKLEQDELAISKNVDDTVDDIILSRDE